jgi:hypothetical protein
MGCIPQQNSVAKGPILYCLDELSKRQDAAERLDALRTGLQQLESRGYQHLNDVLAAYLFPGVYEDPRKIAIFQAYLDEYWFNERKATAEFREHQPVAPTFVAGVIKTISLALNEPTPKTIDAWWVVDHPRFEVINFVTANRVPE